MKKNDYYLYLFIFLIIVLSIYLYYSNYYSKETFTLPNNFHHRTVRLPRAEVEPELERAQLAAVSLPTSYNILTNNSINIGVYDQLGTGTCAAHSLAFALEFFLKKNRISTTERPSRVFIYQFSKWMYQIYSDHTRPSSQYTYDSISRSSNSIIRRAYNCTEFGMNIPFFLPYMSNYKIPTESQYPFPRPPSGYQGGDYGSLCTIIPRQFVTGSAIRNNRRITWETIRSPKVQNIKQHLLSNRPVIIGFQLWSSASNADGALSNSANPQGGARIGSGHFPLPNTSREDYWGDHYAVIIGYNDSTSNFTFRNSWGVNYGNHTGNYTIPYTYVYRGSVNGAFTPEIISIKNYN
jgi:hypothetical protein